MLPQSLSPWGGVLLSRIERVGYNFPDVQKNEKKQQIQTFHQNVAQKHFIQDRQPDHSERYEPGAHATRKPLGQKANNDGLHILTY